MARLDQVYNEYAEEGADFDALAKEQGQLEDIINSQDGHNIDNVLERAADALRLPEWDQKIAVLSGGNVVVSHYVVCYLKSQTCYYLMNQLTI